MPSPSEEQINKVFFVLFPSQCSGCSTALDRDSLATRNGKEFRCLDCSGLDGLELLPPGNVALTRTAQNLSARKAIVLKFNKSRKRCERKGTLVTAQAIEAARVKCEASEPSRMKNRESAGRRREKQEASFVDEFAKKIHMIYPNAPEGTGKRVAEHACQTGSGRVGRTSMAKQLSVGAVSLAVVAYVRHNHTPYDQLLAKGHPRDLAREQIRDKVDNLLCDWAKRAD